MTEDINWSNIKKIFFVGIKGVGMMPLSLIAKDAGFEVAGSDISEEFITDEVIESKRIKVYVDFDTKDIESFFDNTSFNSCLVITTGAHSGYDNPQVIWARKKNIEVLNQGQALGIFMSGKPFNRKLKGLTVTGSHGKTTVSAMLASSFVKLNLDPSYSVGTSRIFPIGESGHYGKGEFFIAEGDEYVGEPIYDKTPKILYQKPEIAVVNNIDFDHPDVYEDIDDVKNTILRFINGIENEGAVFLNSNDAHLIEIKDKIRGDLKVTLYGENNNPKYLISNIESLLGSTKFKVSRDGSFLGDFKISIPGAHNAYNCLAVISVLDFLGKDLEDIKKAVSEYGGCKRRMEKVGVAAGGSLIIDDYGHHPMEIVSTLKALRQFYGKKIVCVFQSHTYSRTRKFLEEFSNAFGQVEKLILLPIFRSQRDSESDIISDEDFSEAFKGNKEVYMSKGIEEAANYIKDLNLRDDTMIVTIGAGDVYKVGYKLIE